MRKNLAKLVQHINMFNFHCTEDSPEYKLLENILTDEQIDVMLKLKIRTPYSMEEVAEKAGISVADATRICDECCMIGVMEYEKDKIKVPLFAPGNMELMVLNREQAEAHPEIAENFIRYVEELSAKYAPMFPKGNGLVIAIPVAEAIEAEPTKVGIETLSYWIDKYSPSLSVGDCQCRRAAEMTDNIGADMPGEWCIQLGEFAESCIRTNRSRRIDKEEAYDILQRAEDLGYLHEVTNVDGKENSMFICNCHPEACLAFRTSRLADTPYMMMNNFVAEVNKENCVACGECMEVCPMNAAKLGQKICQKEPVEIPRVKTPAEYIWTKDRRPEGDFRNEKVDVIPQTGTSPCKTACPAHIAVQGYLKLAGQGRYLEALELIKKENPLPAVCGRICNRRCEDACTMGTIGDPVAIDDVKKFIADKELDEATRFVPKKKWQDGNKLAVIGAGPAGLSCAYYAAVLGHDVTIFEKEEQPGGMLRYGIPTFRLEKNIIDAEIDVLKQLGVQFKFGCTVGEDVTIQQLRDEGYKAFYIAIGAQGGRGVGVPGEDAEGVLSGVEFLRNINADPSKVSLTGPTVVIGGGNVAVDVARSAVRACDSDTYMFCLESREEMPAAADEVAEAEEENIKVNCGWGPKEILVKNGKVCGIVMKRCTSVFDENHRFAPQYDENDTQTIDCSNVLMAVGQSIQWGKLLDGTKVKLNRNNTAVADSFTYQTDEPDIFVGGDVYSGPKFAIDAIAAGKQGADSLHRYSHKGHSLIIGRDHRNFSEIDKDNIIVESYDRPPRQKIATDASKRLSFYDDRTELTEEQVKLETSRCLECGAASVDPNHCVGCALCTTRCKFDAIHLKRRPGDLDFGGDYSEIIPKVAKYAVKRTGRIAKRAVLDAVENRKG